MKEMSFKESKAKEEENDKIYELAQVKKDFKDFRNYEKQRIRQKSESILNVQNHNVLNFNSWINV